MVKIISDSTCDLSPELVNRYDIDILPLHILLGEKEYKDGKKKLADAKEAEYAADSTKESSETFAGCELTGVEMKETRRAIFGGD